MNEFDESEFLNMCCELFPHIEEIRKIQTKYKKAVNIYNIIFNTGGIQTEISAYTRDTGKTFDILTAKYVDDKISFTTKTAREE